jgi:hypothetical protein
MIDGSIDNVRNAMSRSFCTAVLFAALFCAGCTGWLTSNNSPDPTPAGMAGTWTSVSSTTTLTNVCTHFQWTVVVISGSEGSGAFSAVCTNNVQLSGTARATLSGDSMNWTFDGLATPIGGGSACPMTMTSTGTFNGDYFRIPYSGTACSQQVEGTEILKKG